jgi:hypothetical protein
MPSCHPAAMRVDDTHQQSRETRIFPKLSAAAELALSSRWHDRHDAAVVQLLVGASLHTVAETVAEYARRYGVPHDGSSAKRSRADDRSVSLRAD